MNIAQQLNQLQETDLEIQANEGTLKQLTGQLGESPVVVQARDCLASAQGDLEQLHNQQRTAEWEIDDLTAKITPEEQKLYSGRITNTKELSNLKHEIDILKDHRSRLEDTVLEVMEKIERVEEEVSAAGKELARLEAEWQVQQQQLLADIERTRFVLAGLRQARQSQADSIDPQALALYHQLGSQKGAAVSQVEQGICRGCRISLSTATMQQVRSGSLVQCTNCGRILFLP